MSVGEAGGQGDGRVLGPPPPVADDVWRTVTERLTVEAAGGPALDLLVPAAEGDGVDDVDGVDGVEGAVDGERGERSWADEGVPWSDDSLWPGAPDGSVGGSGWQEHGDRTDDGD